MTNSLINAVLVMVLPFFLIGCRDIGHLFGEPEDTGDNGDTSSGSDLDSDSDADSDTGGDGAGCEKMDILFIIDDSGSMECEQSMLLDAFPGFIQVLEDYNNSNADQIDYRLGVTSTGITGETTVTGSFGQYTIGMEGLNGELVIADGMSVPWVDGPGTTSQIVADFSSIALLGTGGTGTEMPLQVMRMAIEKMAPGGANDGFLRDGALFVTMIITDEDDCSMPGTSWNLTEEQYNGSCIGPPPATNLVDLAQYRSYLDMVFIDPARYVVAAVAGATTCADPTYPTVDCPSDEYSGAREAARIGDFVNNHVFNGVFSDICTTEVSLALAEALQLMEVACDDYPDIE